MAAPNRCEGLAWLTEAMIAVSCSLDRQCMAAQCAVISLAHASHLPVLRL